MEVKPPTAEETAAIVERVHKDDPPAHVLKALRTLVLAVRSSQLGLVGFLPDNSRNVYWVAVAQTDEGPIPLAIIPPVSEGPMAWARMIDVLITKHGGAQSDPDYKGSVQ